jgi:hypothetical protein
MTDEEGWAYWSCPHCNWQPDRKGFWKRDQLILEQHEWHIQIPRHDLAILIPYECVKCKEPYVLKVPAHPELVEESGA